MKNQLNEKKGNLRSVSIEKLNNGQKKVIDPTMVWNECLNRFDCDIKLYANSLEFIDFNREKSSINIYEPAVMQKF